MSEQTKAPEAEVKPEVKVETKPPVVTKPEPVKPAKQITLSHYLGGTWVVEFNGRITRRDINRLRTKLLVEFNRLQRKSSIKKRQFERQELERMTNGNGQVEGE